MKNYKVKATRYFKDLVEQEDRFINDEFMCTKERYEFLKSKNGAVELVEILETEKVESAMFELNEQTGKYEKVVDENINDEVSEKVVQAVASAIVEEAEENDKTVEEVVNKIIEEQDNEEEKPRRKSSKK